MTRERRLRPSRTEATAHQDSCRVKRTFDGVPESDVQNMYGPAAFRVRHRGIGKGGHMQPTMHPSNWDNTNQTDDRTYEERRGSGLGAAIAVIAIAFIVILALNLGGDATGDTAGTPGDPAVTESDPVYPIEPAPTTIAP